MGLTGPSAIACPRLPARARILRRAIVAFATGRQGRIVEFSRESVRAATLGGQPALSACAIDRRGRGFVASAGNIWIRPNEGTEWTLAWSDASWDAPFVGLHVDDGRIVAMSATGAVLEGQGV